MKFSVKKLVLSGLFLALALVLPFFTGQIPSVGNMLCPLHIPVLLCGFVCGGPWGLAVGFIAPLLRFLLFQMPPIYPTGLAMAFELATYGLVSGLMYRVLRGKKFGTLSSLLVAMVAGRLVWGVARLVLAGLSANSFTLNAFLTGALVTAIPGIVLQLILIPLIVNALEKAKVIEHE